VTLSIIIVSYNTRGDLERCLASIEQAPPSTSFQIIVVDNASSDGSAEAARAVRGVRVIESPINGGFAAANNTGIRASEGTNLVLLNSDTLMRPGALDVLLGQLERHPDVAIVGPRLVDGSGRAELSFGRMISPLNEMRQKRLVRAYARGDERTVALVESMTRTEQYPDWVSGACLMVRRSDAEAVGLLDERFFMYTEDVDFCASIRARRRRVLFTPAAEIVHLRGRSRTFAPAATDDAYRRSQLAFYEKHHPRLAPLLRLYLRATGARKHLVI
jgi:GT2 family glycosyltransferase